MAIKRKGKDSENKYYKDGKEVGKEEFMKDAGPGVKEILDKVESKIKSSKKIEKEEEPKEKTLEQLAREEWMNGDDDILGNTPGDKLSYRQLLFCKLYTSEEFYGNGVRSYMKAYPDADYLAAKACASRLLTNVNICNEISRLLDEAGLNDNFVDKQLLFVISQHDDLGAKVRGIKEYNKLRQRILERKKIEFTADISPEDRKLMDALLMEDNDGDDE